MQSESLHCSAWVLSFGRMFTPTLVGHDEKLGFLIRSQKINIGLTNYYCQVTSW